MTAGTYAGGTVGIPWLGGLGGGVYVDSHGRIYPQAYGGTPGISLSSGYTPDLEALLTGPSISGSLGTGRVRANVGGNADTLGVGIGTPGVGVTHGFGPLPMSEDYSRPWARPSIRDSAVTAGVPGRYNVFEYGYPDSNPLPPASARAIDDHTAENHEAPPPVGNRALLRLVRRNRPSRWYELDSEAQSSVSEEDLPAAPPPLDGHASEPLEGLFGRLVALTGIDPRNPRRLAPPPRSDLRGFYREAPGHPWLLDRWR